MPDSAPGYAGRSEEAQCYNCGASGHWAIACPEPTRETPAGLAAWRNSTNMASGHSRDEHGSTRKSKGPIITKYAPPPSTGPMVTRYAPPSGYSQTAGPYPTGPSPYPQPYPPYASSPPGYGPSYPLPTYPPQPYPIPTYNSPPPGPPGTSGYRHGPPLPYGPPHPAGLPSHTAAYPSAYGPPSGQPPPPGYASQLPRGPPYSRPSSYSPYPPSFPPPNTPPTHPPAHPPPVPVLSGSLAVPSHTPPSATHLPGQGRGALSLPPKPPRSRDFPEPHRDHRNKRKHEKQNRHRENRNRNQSQNPRGPNQKSQDHNRRSGSRGGQNKKPARSPRPQERKRHDSRPEPAVEEEPPPKVTESPKPKVEEVSISDPAKDDTPPVDDPIEDEWEWEKEKIFNEVKPQHDPDEVGRPLPTEWSEEADNLDEFMKPLHETGYWDSMEFDPAFARDGKLPCGDALPGKSVQAESPHERGRARSEHLRKHDRSDDDLDEREMKKRRSDSAPGFREETSGSHDLTESALKSFESAEGKSRKHCGLGRDKTPVGEENDILSLNKGDPQSLNRRGSHESRRSSLSAASSDLNSLEAELLGRSSKAKTPEATENLKRRDSDSNSRFKRRQPRMDSAYSRRW